VELSFTSVAVVGVAAFVAPLAVALTRLPVPAVALEIVAGIVIGPSLLGWVQADAPVDVLAMLGLAFLLFLAGLEVDFELLRGRLLRLTSLGFAVSFALALGVGAALSATGITGAPLLLAIMLSATSLGVVIPVLKDSGESATAFGQTVIGAASIADIATVVLLSLFFSGESGSAGAKVVLLGGFGVLVAAVAVSVATAGRSLPLSSALVRLQDTTAQIRVRGAFALLTAFVVAATQFGLEAILGAFVAGAVLKLLDKDQAMTHPRFRGKLEATGFGVFVPFFFVASGARLDLGALASSGSSLARVPLFLAALILVRAVPALLYVDSLGRRRALAAGLLQATSLSFLVVAGRIGMELGLISAATGAALVAAGLVSVLVFPAAALSLLAERSDRALEPELAG
jgi:Kef-type K+ transport system membrane component KefB